MGKSHCICKEEPCRCFNGWGTHFRSEGELLAAIGQEIRMSKKREYWGSEDWDRPVNGFCVEDEDEVIEMWEDGYNALEIAMSSDMSLTEVRLILKKYKAKLRKSGRVAYRTGGVR